MFPVVSQQLKPADKKRGTWGIYSELGLSKSLGLPLTMGVAGHDCEPHEGKPNYLLQEARNEEALARLDMNRWCTCGRAGCTGTLGVRFMGENWGGNVRHSQFPPRGHNPPLTPVTAHIYANVNLSKQKH